MKILVLGGTGAIGEPLVKELSDKGHTLWVTSRSKSGTYGNVIFVQGDAKNDIFLTEILEEHYDVIIDFMVYSTLELKKRIDILLYNTNHYFFFSSSRVYANHTGRLTEDSPRLLDVCQDSYYLLTDEYALAKAREENILRTHDLQNWTIIRPYITYNNYRLQLGVLEKESWLYRALHGRTIVFSKDIANKTTALTHGLDVAHIICNLIGKEKVKGQAFHITTSEYMYWRDILEIYLDTVYEEIGFRPNVIYIDNVNEMSEVWNYYQIKYDRLYDRKFDNSKISSFCDNIEYKSMLEGLRQSISSFLKEPRWLNINWKYEAWADRQTHEHTSLKEIPGLKNKLRYIKYRYIT